MKIWENGLGDAFYSNDYLGFILNFSEIINIDSVDPASEYLPAGYLEIEVQSLDGFSLDGLIISLLTSLGEEASEYIGNIEQYSQQISDEWVYQLECLSINSLTIKVMAFNI